MDNRKKYIPVVIVTFMLLGALLVVLVISLINTSRQINNNRTTTTTINITTSKLPEDISTTTTTMSSNVLSSTSNIVTSTTSTVVTTSRSKNISTNSTTKKIVSSTTTKATSTTKKTTTKKTTTKKTLIGHKYEHENNETFKYGVKITNTKIYQVYTYSDGSVKKELYSSSVTYDRSTYNATTNDLISEATSLASNNKNTYEEMLKYVNQYRAEVNEEALILDDELSKLATIRALELAWGFEPTLIAHKRPDGREWHTVYTDMNYKFSYIGENIAAGQKDVATVSKGWKNSSGHYKNMVNSNYVKIGFGHVKVNNINYWVQLFAK